MQTECCQCWKPHLCNVITVRCSHNVINSSTSWREIRWMKSQKTQCDKIRENTRTHSQPDEHLPFMTGFCRTAAMVGLWILIIPVRLNYRFQSYDKLLNLVLSCICMIDLMVTCLEFIQSKFSIINSDNMVILFLVFLFEATTMNSFKILRRLGFQFKWLRL